MKCTTVAGILMGTQRRLRMDFVFIALHALPYNCRFSSCISFLYKINELEREQRLQCRWF